MIANRLGEVLLLLAVVTLPATHESRADSPSKNGPSEAEAQAAWKAAGVYFRVRRPSAYLLNSSEVPSHCSIYFSGTKVTDQWMRFLPAFADLTEVRFSESTQVTDKSFQFIAQLPNLKYLRLASSRIRGRELKQLVACKNLRRLQIKSAALDCESEVVFDALAKLNLDSLEFGGRSTDDAALVGIGKLTTLRSLTLNVGRGENDKALVSGKTFAALASLTQLTSLQVMGDDIRQHAALSGDDLAALRRMPQLTDLTLSSKLLTDDGMKHIAACQKLTSLSIWHAPITDQGLETLAPLRKLQSLHLYGTKVTGTGLHVWATDNGEVICPIQSLSLIGRAATNQGMFQVARLNRLSSLRIGCPNGWFVEDGMLPVAVSNHGVRVLCQLPALERLGLGHLDVSDVGFASLGKCPSLITLDIKQLPITDRALEEFGAHSEATQLVFSDCGQLTRAGLQKLHTKLSGAMITVVRDGRTIGTLQAGGKTIWK